KSAAERPSLHPLPLWEEMWVGTRKPGITQHYQWQRAEGPPYPTGSVIASSSQASMNPSSKAPSSKAKTKGMSSVDFIRPMRESKSQLLVLTTIANTNEPFRGVRRPPKGQREAERSKDDQERND